VEQGTKEDAQWASLAANKRHGLRRSQADKRRAIKRALKGWGADKSDREIARHVGCSNNTVSRMRRSLCESHSQPERTGADGRTIDTSNIGGSSSGGPDAAQEESEMQPEGGATLADRAERGREKAEANGQTPEDALSGKLDKAARSKPTPERQEEREQRKEEYRQRQEIESFPEEGEYGVIYADPPWQYNNSGLDEYGHAERHYDTMSINDVCELPVSRIAGEDCALYLWTTSPMLEDAFYVLSSWGFDYKTSYVWDKIAHNHGHYNSVRHEMLLVATRGDGTPERSKLYDSVVSIRRGKHSEKPPYFRRLLDVLYPSAEKIELFARDTEKGWDAWGDEV